MQRARAGGPVSTDEDPIVVVTIERRAKELLDTMHHAPDGVIAFPAEIYSRIRPYAAASQEHVITVHAASLLVARGLAKRVQGFFPEMPTFRLVR